ncbi:MAG: lysylphosphatidylglycerol synthase domain-containing protein [Patescibacteria group bacterium]
MPPPDKLVPSLTGSHAKKIWLWIRRFAGLIAALLLLRMVMKNTTELQTTISELHYGSLVLAVLFIGLGFFISSLAWGALLSAQGWSVPIRLAWWSSTHSLLIRYLPGGIPGLAARVDVMRQFGLRLSHRGWNVIIEMSLASWTAIIFFFVGGWANRVPIWLNWMLVLGFIVGLLGLVFLTSERNQFTQWRTRLRIPSFMTRPVAVIIFWFLIGWAVFGAAHFFLAQSMDIQKSIGFLEVTGLYAISWIAGLVAVFTPSGLGVREATMIGLLQPLVGPQAIIFALLARLVFTAGELLNLIVAWLLRPRTVK